MDNRLYSIDTRNKFGGNCQFGNIMPGDSHYGEQVKYIALYEFGVIAPGITQYGDVNELNGIYHKKYVNNEPIIEKLPWYVTKNPRTETQQSNRNKFGQAVASWHNLTNEQKAVYNIESKKTRGTGFNLYIHNYMHA